MNSCFTLCVLHACFVFLNECFVLFLFYLSTCVCVCYEVHGPWRECFGQALPGFLITAHHLCPFLVYWECQLCGGKTSKNLGLISFLNNVRLIIMIGAPRRWKLRCRKWISFETKCSGVHIHLPRNLCSRPYTMPDLSSVVPVPCFATTMRYSFFLSFFLWFVRLKPITGLSGC